MKDLTKILPYIPHGVKTELGYIPIKTGTTAVCCERQLNNGECCGEPIPKSYQYQERAITEDVLNQSKDAD